MDDESDTKNGSGTATNNLVVKKPERPSWVAIISLVIACLGAAFTVYQWWNGERQARISAAIDLSIKNIQDSGIAKLRQDFSDFVNDVVAPSERIQKNFAADAFVMYLDYVAQLSNLNRLDEAYMSIALKCQIYGNYENLYLKKGLKNPAYFGVLPSPTRIHDLSEYYRVHQGLECR